MFFFLATLSAYLMKNVFEVYVEWFVIVMMPALRVIFAKTEYANKDVVMITHAMLIKLVLMANARVNIKFYLNNNNK